MQVGMSLACFYPLEPEKAVEKAAEIGIDVCEIFLNTWSEMDVAYLQALRQECDRCGIRVYSVHPFTSAFENYLFFSPYPRRIADAERLYRQYADAAKILGAEVISIHGDRGLGLDDMDAYLRCIEPLLKLQDETGIAYAMENVYFNSVNDPEFVSKLRQRQPNVRFTFDIKQAFKGGRSAYDVATAMGNAIVNFHVNDRDEHHICMLPGQGDVDYLRLAHILEQANYKGPALIEVYS
ncbi:MAG: sugar phosphate isomerase/epimerase, partial [Clostridia bacterium]|nr:sugar phosphate isomerase/epimerase [Clostridia bacterium]